MGLARILSAPQLRSSTLIGCPPYYRLALACGEPPCLGDSTIGTI